MRTTEEVMLLRDPALEPTAESMEEALGKELYGLYGRIMQICDAEFGLSHQWRFYNDGKAWLCKVVERKKTLFWLSAWEGFIKTSFHFTEKTRSGVMELTIDAKLKSDFAGAAAAGKLIPLILDIRHEKQLDDLREIISYKKAAK